MNISRCVPALALSLAIAVPLCAAERKITRLPAATLVELAAVDAPPPMVRETRHDKRPRRGLTSMASLGALETQRTLKARLTASATIGAPPVATSFVADSSGHLSPADSSGAVGKTHVVAASNAGIVVQTRAGTMVRKLTLTQFWRNGPLVVDVYDPRIVYDALSDRWITVAIDNETSVLVAASATGDPNGAWFRYSITVPGCDFTRLALTRDTILVSTILDYGESASLFAISKQSLYAGTGSFSTTETPIPAEAALVDNADSTERYVVFAAFGKLFVRRLDVASPAWQTIESGDNWYSWERQAPQAGSNIELDIGYAEVEAAALRGGWLYAVHRVGRTSRTADDNALIWWRIKPGATTTPEFGIIDAPSADTIYAYPSMAVNRDGAMLITWCTMSPTTWPSVSYLYRDPAGRVSTTAQLRAGESPVMNSSRWGDYTTTVVDPLNDRDFWAVQLAAKDNAWVTFWAQVKAPRTKSRVTRH